MRYILMSLIVAASLATVASGEPIVLEFAVDHDTNIHSDQGGAPEGQHTSCNVWGLPGQPDRFALVRSVQNLNGLDSLGEIVDAYFIMQLIGLSDDVKPLVYKINEQPQHLRWDEADTTWDNFNTTVSQPWPGFVTLVGDVNLDGNVNVADMNILALNINRPGEYTWTEGDLDNDQDVDTADMTLMALNWQKSMSDPGQEGQVLYIDATPWIENWVSSTLAYNGILIAPGVDGFLTFDSSEWIADRRPKFYVKIEVP